MKVVSRLICFFALGCVALTFVGCSTERNFDSDSFDDNVVLLGEVRNLGVYWSPENMCVVKDTMLLINNKGCQDSMYMVVNSSDWSVRYIFGNRKSGFAKPEIVNNRDDVMIYDHIHNRFTTVTSRGELSHKTYGVTDSDIPSAISCVDGTYFYKSTPFNSADVIVKIEDKNRTQIHDFMPLLQTSRTPYSYFGSMVVSPSGDKFLYAYKYQHRFDIFDSNGSVVSENINLSAPSMVMKGEGGVDRLNSNIYYASASATADRIYLYYIGHSENESKADGDLVTYVEEFDWSGNPIKRYQLDRVYSSVSYVDELFVAISPEGDFRFVTYAIE